MDNSSCAHIAGRVWFWYVHSAYAKIRPATRTPPRPLTHNLLENTIEALGTLQRVEIIARRNKTVIGRLQVKDARGLVV